MKPKNASEVRAFLQNRSLTPVAEVPVVNVEGATATIRLFDPIDSWGEWWGMSAKEFAAAIDGLPSHVATIELLINSPGGDTFDAAAMINVLRAHPARTVAVVQGIAASAASLIACAADETVMAPNSTLMIHEAWGVCVGSAGDMLEYAALLEQVCGNMAGIYAEKSGKSIDEIRDVMAAEVWLTAEQAVTEGYADSVAQTSTPDQPSSSVKATDADLRSLIVAELTERGLIPSGEPEEPPTGTAGEPDPVDPEQASRLLSILTLNQGVTPS